jgi:hypothetical protein
MPPVEKRHVRIVKMDDAERLRLLADQTKTWYGSLTDHVFRHTAIQIVVLGWALSSDGPSNRVEDLSGPLQAVVFVLPLAYSALVFTVFMRLRDHSRAAFLALNSLDEPTLLSDLKPYRIEFRFWFGMACGHAVLSLVIILLLFS